MIEERDDTLEPSKEGTFTSSVLDRRLFIEFGEKATEVIDDDVYDLIVESLMGGVQTILIVKRSHPQDLCMNQVRVFGRKLGRLLCLHEARLAMVNDPVDCYEAAMCNFAMQQGAKVFTTDTAREALLWLDGEIA
ncbi:hypothetical protein HBA54_22585 [Pelagibius litoralis]|uniref:DUF4180 domain-containing protein n=1 Tax=Pelagibius litoralis TaxID=374515 RepID=A0A967F1R2_9PROT|nr:hypothetical protein [Pelagibius litoralis]NIA71387.1 hypothetical protein [Pelagibius litoralis]